MALDGRSICQKITHNLHRRSGGCNAFSATSPPRHLMNIANFVLGRKTITICRGSRTDRGQMDVGVTGKGVGDLSHIRNCRQ